MPKPEGNPCYHCSSQWQGGNGIKEGSTDSSGNNQHVKELPDGGSQDIKPPQQTPFLNPDPFQCWHRVEHIARVRVNGESYMAFLDNGTHINMIMPKYVSDHSLQMGPITNLSGAKVSCLGLGNAYMRPLGYAIIWVQVDAVQGYDKDQIALVIPDLSNFVAQIPVILGTPTISLIIIVMKEMEIDALAIPWANARVAHLLSIYRMTAVKIGDGIEEESSSDDYDQVMFTQNVETIEVFSHVVPVKVGKALHWRACQCHDPSLTD